MLLTRSPLYSPNRSRAFSFDLHVLDTPPAFVLSQDQTLRIFQINYYQSETTKNRPRSKTLSLLELQMIAKIPNTVADAQSTQSRFRIRLLYMTRIINLSKNYRKKTAAISCRQVFIITLYIQAVKKLVNIFCYARNTKLQSYIQPFI